MQAPRLGKKCECGCPCSTCVRRECHYLVYPYLCVPFTTFVRRLREGRGFEP